ncbi:hypothetical protein [Paenibacillus sp. PK3_47]|uniref:hypothetical protein n=1 Tax=Paenibacillus sp. PK3_47 TaxID=2072642 RepID=UPI00201E2894|nr:hypothetical protein [Paenibacillus sp. PK3_47]
MENNFVASPYAYNDKNKPISWGVWNNELKIWIPHLPSKKKEAEELAKSLNRLAK